MIGYVDGSVGASTRRFHVVLTDDAVVQLDDLVVLSQELPGGQGTLTHYGIVVEGKGAIEGAERPSDTQRIAHDKTMPGVTIRVIEVQVLRTDPERWIPPQPGAAVYAASGEHRNRALFLDQMERRLAIGLDQADQPIYADFDFINGEKGAHVSISGISGVATKTSYALFLLFMIFETDEGRTLLGAHAPNTRAIVFNVKGEDLLHIDRPNTKYSAHPEAPRQWAALSADPRPFRNVRIFVPRSQGGRRDGQTSDLVSRPSDEVTIYGWTPYEFIRQGLLEFCLSDANDARNQLSFIEQRVRVQLARWAHPLAGEDGAVVMLQPESSVPHNLARISQLRRAPQPAGDRPVLRDFGDIVEFLVRAFEGEPDEWTGSTQQNTVSAFIRRLYALIPRLGQLITTRIDPIETTASVNVIDIHRLHDDAQRFVVGALLSRQFYEKVNRLPLQFVVLDELNKYAPRTGTSPLKELLVDIAARGRSLGILLIGAQQNAGTVEPAVTDNASLKVVGRLDAGSADTYKFLSPELRERASRFLPGTMVLDQPVIPAPLPIRFPFAPYATSAQDSGSNQTPQEREAQAARLFERL